MKSLYVVNDVDAHKTRLVYDSSNYDKTLEGNSDAAFVTTKTSMICIQRRENFATKIVRTFGHTFIFLSFLNNS